jgi:hypothetical protein
MASRPPRDKRGGIGMKRTLLAGLLLAALLVILPSTAPSAADSAIPPSGATGLALDGKAELAWQPVSGATGYTVYRGTSPTAVTTLLTPAAGTPGTVYTDSTASNGTTYYYAVRSIVAGAESANSSILSVTPATRSCSSGNAIVLENCYPGTTSWRLVNPSFSGDIEGYATAQSIAKGDSIGIKVTADAQTTMHAEIYRSGYYGGQGARLFSTIRNIPVGSQPPCFDDATNTGLYDCSSWNTNFTITTTSSWPTGVYLVRLVRDDNGQDNHVIFVVRGSPSSQILDALPFSTYEAYNNYGGKSLYTNKSSGATTVSGTARAVKVSFDRPFVQARSSIFNDWYTRSDYPGVSWLEREGYDVSYASNTDLETSGSGFVASHHVYWDGGHDEYWSAGMRNAVTQARDSGTHLFFSGSNEIYWKVRFESSPISGTSNRVEVCYKTVESGGPDPTGAKTSTWRDPNGPNQPENAVSGQMYVGDADNTFFPLVVGSAEGKDRVWRFTSLANQAPGASTRVGTSLVGWEWDARNTTNGAEPPGLKVVGTSPVTGNLIQNFGQNSTAGSTNVTVTKYYASSGALVFATGTNFWWRGLATNVDGAGEPDVRIQQATTNVLEDMWVYPQTPASNLTLDDPALAQPPAPPSASAQALPNGGVKVSWTPVPGASGYNVYRSTSPRTGGLPLGAQANISLVTGSSFTDTGLPASTTFYYVVTAVGGGSESLASSEAQTTTVTPLGVIQTTPNDGATGITTAVAPTAQFSRSADPNTITSSSFTLRNSSGALVPATVTYDAAHLSATLTPNAQLATSTTYTARLDTTITGSDGVPLAQPVTWTFSTSNTVPPPPTVVTQNPTPNATGVGGGVEVDAFFSRAMSAASITAASFTLTGPNGSVAAIVTYDATQNKAALDPKAALPGGATYTARIDTTVLAQDGTPLASPVSWSFTTAQPPTITAVAPADSSGNVARDATVTATFSRAMDGSTITASNFTLTAANGPSVSASVSYDAASQTATLTPTQLLAGSTVYTARVDSSAADSQGTGLAAPVSWTFSTRTCPCTLFPNSLAPAQTNLPTQDGRTGIGPWSYEMGVKVTVDQATQVNAIRFYKAPLESGTHTGKIWSASGTTLTTVTFVNESPSGWQQQTLSTPYVLQPGQVYVVSVNMNNYFSQTQNGLVNQVISGPLRSVADGLNGVFGATSGVFPNKSFKSSNYFVDLQTAPDGTSTAPTVTSTSPANGAVNVAPTTTVRASFSRSMDPASLTSANFSVKAPDGTNVAGTVAYDDSTLTATFTPTAPLSYYLAYTAKLSNFVRARDGQQLSPLSWSFTIQNPPPPQVTLMVPSNGVSDVGPNVKPRADFSKSMDGTTITPSTFTLTDGSGTNVAAAVSYDDSSHAATLTPNAPLISGATYTARVDGGVRAADGSSLGTAVAWSFTVSPVPPPSLAVSSTTPTNGSTGAGRESPIQVTFNRSVDPDTVNAATVKLTTLTGTAVASSVSWDVPSLTASIQPNALLAASTGYRVTLAGVATADGSSIQSSSFTFTTGICGCQLFPSTLAPAKTGNPTQDGRTGTGPWSYEMGVKFTVDQAMSLKAIRFFKDPKEIGSHTGTIWSSGGTKLASVPFTNETASGWQQANLATPLQLQPGVVYVASVGFNAYFDVTTSGLSTQYISGPLKSVKDGANGVFASAAGLYPTSSYQNSNYFVDVLVR